MPSDKINKILEKLTVMAADRSFTEFITDYECIKLMIHILKDFEEQNPDMNLNMFSIDEIHNMLSVKLSIFYLHPKV